MNGITFKLVEKNNHEAPNRKCNVPTMYLSSHEGWSLVTTAVKYSRSLSPPVPSSVEPAEPSTNVSHFSIC